MAEGVETGSSPVGLGSPCSDGHFGGVAAVVQWGPFAAHNFFPEVSEDDLGFSWDIEWSGVSAALESISTRLSMLELLQWGLGMITLLRPGKQRASAGGAGSPESAQRPFGKTRHFGGA